MPTHASITPDRPRVQADLDQSSTACPLPLTPPPETHDDGRLDHVFDQEEQLGQNERVRRVMNDNTAGAMSMLQEESMYPSAPSLEEKLHADHPEQKMEVDMVTGTDIDDDEDQSSNRATEEVDTAQQMSTPSSDQDRSTSMRQSTSQPFAAPMSEKQDEDRSHLASASSTSWAEEKTGGFGRTPGHAGVPPIDQELDWSSDVKAWDFSHRRLRPQYPSATFQPYSVFKGTQQSDRQIYNVEVTILTVDIEQASMSGYLQICGLTPDHPTLTTFFTGEIIGGPDQKYSFRTCDPTWGASDKTDLTHWARFPAWRPLSLQAKRNINFVYPMNHENWWQQEHIFMRWKEHFLVPDYKLKSIQGASFEGFYYICFNQVEGRVSGIYFHSKSEKYQQLELKHEGKQGVWGNGVCPSIEFR